MWQIIPSVGDLLQPLLAAFTAPSFQTHLEVFIGWVMTSGKRTEYRVFQTIWADTRVTRAERHPFDRFYNFFSRSAWEVKTLAYQVAKAMVVALNPTGKLFLVVDDTLLHKRGVKVWGLGWFRDAVASTAKRVATASGNNWVVVGLAVPVPFCPRHVLCLPLLARLHLPGKGQPSPPQLARQMLAEILGWYPDRQIVLIGDGAYAAEKLLKGLDPRVTYVGRMRADAQVYDPVPPKTPKGKRGPKPKKGARLPSPKEAAKRADRNRSGKGPFVWQEVEATAYGVTRKLQVLCYQVVWPKVLGLRPILVVVVRDPTGKFKDTYLFTTDLDASLSWVIETFSWRWSIEVAFRASKQVLGIEAPQHWCQGSIEKLAPWIWLMHSVISLWYLKEGHSLPEAEQARQQMGPWDSEWSLRHMVTVLRDAILGETIKQHSAQSHDPTNIINFLKNCVNIAA